MICNSTDLSNKRYVLAMATIFEETLDSDSDEDAPSGMKGEQVVTVSNGLTEDLFVQICPVNLVHQTERADRQFAIGASPLEASFEFQIGRGATKMNTFKSDSKKQSVTPHSVWNTPVPMSTLKPWTKGKTANVENSLSIKVFTTDTESGVDVEIGQGYIVGPGHGLIITQINGNYRVEQARGRSWRRKFNPWVNNQKGSRDPHAKLMKWEVCPMCHMEKM